MRWGLIPKRRSLERIAAFISIEEKAAFKKFSYILFSSQQNRDSINIYNVIHVEIKKGC